MPTKGSLQSLNASEQNFPLSSVGSVDRLVGVRVHAPGRRNIDRAREIIDDGIDEILDALVLESGTADNRDELVRDGLAADACFENLAE